MKIVGWRVGWAGNSIERIQDIDGLYTDDL
jgi:hypothetical protein